MSTYCDLCKRKIGLFESVYTFYPYKILCEECYFAKKKQEKEEKKRQEKDERIARAEAKKRATDEKLAKIKEKKEKEREIEKQKKEKEKEKERKIEKQNKEKLEKLEINSNNLKEQILNNEVVFHKYNELLEEYHAKDLSNMIIDILYEMPTFNTFEKMTQIKMILNIMKKTREISNEYTQKLIYRYEKKPVFLLQDCSESIFNHESMFVNTLKNDINNINENLEKILETMRILEKRRYHTAEYQMKEEEKKQIQEELEFNKFLLLYFRAISLLYLIKMLENAKKLKKNKELYLIYENLANAKLSREYISEKIFELYNEFYLKTFNHKLEKKEIECIIYILEQEKYYGNVIIKNIDDDDDLKKIKEKLTKTKEIKEKIKIIEDFTVSNSLKIIGNTEINAKLAIEIYYMHIINALKENINFIELFEVLEEFDTIFKKVDKSVKSVKLTKERERLLKGDLSKEIEMKKLELDFNSIKDGFEFEKYVAELYKKLGYKIEEVTKKSGDQGADVVAYKDDIKYVIQAKFYGSPVGNKAVQEVVASIGMYKADKGIVVTNSTFTPAAIELAKANNVELVDGDKIEKYKNQILSKI